MADDPLRDRGNSLEEEFFLRQNAELVERLRATEAREEARRQMLAASGLNDPALIDQLLDQGVTPASFVALSLAPLAAVAWADRTVDQKERAAILGEATAAGMDKDSDAYRLLEGWLTTQPGPSLMTVWGGYARELSASLDHDQRMEVRESLIARAKTVAKAAGGFAGIATISPEEQRVLDAIDSALAD